MLRKAESHPKLRALVWKEESTISGVFLPRSPTGVCCRGTHGVLSSRRSASLFQRAGSSSQPSGPWPHTSPSCWPSGRSHTGGGGCEVRRATRHGGYRSVTPLNSHQLTHGSRSLAWLKIIFMSGDSQRFAAVQIAHFCTRHLIF